MRHFRAEARAAFLSSRFMRGLPGHQAGCVLFPSGVCAPSQALAPGAGLLQERSAAVGVGGGGGGADPREPSMSSQTLVPRAAPQGTGAGPPQSGHSCGHSLGDEGSPNLDTRPGREASLSSQQPCTRGASRHSSSDTPASGLPPRLEACPPGPSPPFWGKPRPPGEDLRPAGSGLILLLADHQPPPASCVITPSWE